MRADARIVAGGGELIIANMTLHIHFICDKKIGCDGFVQSLAFDFDDETCALLYDAARSAGWNLDRDSGVDSCPWCVMLEEDPDEYQHAVADGTAPRHERPVTEVECPRVDNRGHGRESSD